MVVMTLRGRNSIDIVGSLLYFVAIMYLEAETVGNSGCTAVASVPLAGGGLWVTTTPPSTTAPLQLFAFLHLITSHLISLSAACVSIP
jgi:hypothetical protein